MLFSEGFAYLLCMVNIFSLSIECLIFSPSSFLWLESCAGTTNNWKNQSLIAHAMSAMAHGNFASSRGLVNEKTEPDHLLVLVHGILARYDHKFMW